MTGGSLFVLLGMRKHQGDSGFTTLTSGSRISKADEVVMLVGKIDTVNSMIGFALSLTGQEFSGSKDLEAVLRKVQSVLWDLGPAIEDFNISVLSTLLDKVNLLEEDYKLKKFISYDKTLSPIAYLAVISRYVREIECWTVKYVPSYTMKDTIIAILNRLSTIIFNLYAKLV